MDRRVQQATVHGVTRVGHDLVTKPPPTIHKTEDARKSPWCRLDEGINKC